MAHTIALPSLSAGMEDAVVARFLKRPGDLIEKGDVLAEIETDKATMELEADASGILADLPVSAGSRLKVGDPVAFLLAKDEKPDASENRISTLAPKASETAEKPLDASRHKASPLARRLAKSASVDVALLLGSGPRGRVVRIDVEKAIATRSHQPVVSKVAALVPTTVPKPPGYPPGIGEFEVVEHSSMRRTIARRLAEAKSTIPHFYLDIDCELDALIELRSKINANREEHERISVNDFVIKAAAATLQNTPEMNVIFTEDAMLHLKSVDIAVAVATPGGLVTPIVRNSERKSIGAISEEMKALAGRARQNALKPDEYQGGGLTISNLGMYGVTAFSAILNPPQSAILAVGAAEKRPVVRNDKLSVGTMMTCTLSVDHRAIDGATAARFLKLLKQKVETPMLVLV